MMSFLKTIVLGVLWCGADLRGRASILMYHSVGNNKAFFSVKPEVFEKQIAYLRKHYQIVKLSDLVAMMSRGEDISRCVAITFDDGYLDNYTNAFPILKTYNIPCTIFLATDYIGKEMTNSEGVTLPMLTKEMIRHMIVTGLVECMPHSKSHQNFDTLPNVAIEKEIVESRHVVEQFTQQNARVFSFPRGVVAPHAFSVLTAHDFQAAVTVEEGTVSPTDNLFTLKRNSIDSSTSCVQFKAKTSTAIDRYVKYKTAVTSKLSS